MGCPLKAFFSCISKVSWVIYHREKFIFVMQNDKLNILHV